MTNSNSRTASNGHNVRFVDLKKGDIFTAKVFGTDASWTLEVVEESPTAYRCGKAKDLTTGEVTLYGPCVVAFDVIAAS